MRQQRCCRSCTSSRMIAFTCLRFMNQLLFAECTQQTAVLGVFLTAVHVIAIFGFSSYLRHLSWEPSCGELHIPIKPQLPQGPKLCPASRSSWCHPPPPTHTHTHLPHPQNRFLMVDLHSTLSSKCFIFHSRFASLPSVLIFSVLLQLYCYC